jgi:ABC-2 type transport system permease protein
MRKVFVIAAREYNAAVRTKAFVISLLMMPLLMGGSIAVQTLLKDQPSTEVKGFAVIDRTPGRAVFSTVVEKAQDPTANPRHEKWRVEAAEPADSSDDALDRLRGQLSERARRGDLVGFAEIGPKVFEPAPAVGQAKPDEDHAVHFRANRPTEVAFANLVQQVVTAEARRRRFEAFHVPADQAGRLAEPVGLKVSGPTTTDDTGKQVDTSSESQLVAFLTPLALLMLMFMVILMTATPLMQGVVEEKMQRIAEVLLGSVRPFQLMLGKLLGMAGVSLTISTVYLGGGWWLAHHFNHARLLGGGLLAWFLVYQALATLMYGSLFAAIGAACTDMKETQTLLWPVMLLVVWPTFLVGSIMQEPNGPLVTRLSFFPFATPMLMAARMGVPPGVPWWQPLVGVAGVLTATVACVWAAGRIFRVGILLQGKGARFGEMVRWVFRG